MHVRGVAGTPRPGAPHLDDFAYENVRLALGRFTCSTGKHQKSMRQHGLIEGGRKASGPHCLECHGLLAAKKNTFVGIKMLRATTRFLAPSSRAVRTSVRAASSYVAAIDQGTSSTRVILYDVESGAPVDSHQVCATPAGYPEKKSKSGRGTGFPGYCARHTPHTDARTHARARSRTASRASSYQGVG